MPCRRSGASAHSWPIASSAASGCASREASSETLLYVEIDFLREGAQRAPARIERVFHVTGEGVEVAGRGVVVLGKSLQHARRERAVRRVVAGGTGPLGGVSQRVEVGGFSLPARAEEGLPEGVAFFDLVCLAPRFENGVGQCHAPLGVSGQAVGAEPGETAFGAPPIADQPAVPLLAVSAQVLARFEYAVGGPSVGDECVFVLGAQRVAAPAGVEQFAEGVALGIPFVGV
jgi:hypothetical protein